MNDNKPYTLESIIKFGKYRLFRYTLLQLIDLDPKIVKWYQDNVDWFEIDNESQETLTEYLQGNEK